MVKKHCDPEYHEKMMYMPVVDSTATMNLMYLVKMDELKDYCELYFGFVGEEGQGIGVQLTQNQPQGSPMRLPNPKNL
jgi:hypothetical protein